MNTDHACPSSPIEPDPFAPAKKSKTKPWYLQRRDELRRLRWALVPHVLGPSVFDDPIADGWFR